MRRVAGYSTIQDSITSLTQQYQQYEFSNKFEFLSNHCNAIDLNKLLKFDSYAFFINSDISLKKKCYYKLRRNKESIDSFTIIDHDVFFFQFTTAKTHPVSAFGIQKIFATISENFKNESFNFYLIFIGIEADDNLIFMKEQNITLTKELLISNADRYNADSLLMVSSTINSPKKKIITSNLSINLNQMKWGIKLHNPNDITLLKGKA
jgi:hypothetical protein